MEVRNTSEGTSSVSDHAPRRGMILPFQPLSLAFDHVNYYVDMPAVSPSFETVSPFYNLCEYMHLPFTCTF